jgi:hypothetical protein
MAFDSQTRNKLQRMVSACRRLLTEEFDDQLQELYGIYAQDGRMLELEKLTSLDDDAYQIATLLRERVKHLISGMASDKHPLADAVRRVLREQAFTVLNRFAALRMAEERGFVQACVGQGLKSKGFQVFETVARSGLGGAYERYVTFVHGMFDELSLDMGVLFDRLSPFGLLFPREPALLKFFDLLNDPELKSLWKEDETIGWIYQYFNDEAERKKMREESAAPRNSRELAVRNQFFTPRYVVEFLTDNTLGRIWYEMSQGQTRLKDQCRYLVRRPDEVFFGDSTQLDGLKGDPGTVRAAKQLTDAGEPNFSSYDRSDIQRMIEMCHVVNGYVRRPLGEETYSWMRDFKERVFLPQDYAKTRTQDLLDALFLECRADRHGGQGEIYNEPWFAGSCNEVRRRSLRSKETNPTQDELLKQVAFIPFRPLKDPRTILMLDPACGSMHFGLYAFDLFEVIYDEAWELEKRGAEFQPRPQGTLSLQETYGTKEDFLKDVPRLIIEHNLHGIDIDPRCAQIAGLSLWLRAQTAWQRLGLKPAERPAIKRSNIVCAESMPGEKQHLKEFCESLKQPVIGQMVEIIFDKMRLAGEAGSLLKIEEEIRDVVHNTKLRWTDTYRFDQANDELFSKAEIAAVSKARKTDAAELNIDFSGITDETFWEKAEERIYAALRDYAEQAENGGGFQRRLFAEDAARGFAFIDVCRKRYDVVEMNPPFGAAVFRTTDLLDSPLTSGRSDIYSSFMARAIGFLQSGGRVGALTSRTFLVLSSFSNLRRHLLATHRSFALCADLGMGVLDGAGVYAAASVFWGSSGGSVRDIEFFDCRETDTKDGELLSAIQKLGADRRFCLPAEAFDAIPNYAMPYWAGGKLFACYSSFPAFEPACGFVRQGLSSGDDVRWLRLWWEAMPATVGRQRLFSNFEKGGDFCPFYHDSMMLLRWNGDGRELKTFAEDTYGSAGKVIYGTDHFFKAGLSYSRLTVKGFHVRVLPEGQIFSSAGMFIGTSGKVDAWTALGYLNSKVVRDLLGMITDGRKWEIGYVQKIPTPEFTPALKERIAQHGQTLFRLVRQICANDEIDRGFSGRRASVNQQELERSEQLLNRDCNAALGFPAEQSACADSLISLWLSDLETGEEAEANARISYSVGCTFGRWDILYAPGEQAPPELPDAFAPLPVCPPGQLQNAQGLPARPEDVPTAYPVRIPWDGILVDDPNHPLDIDHRVREVIEIIWTDRAEAIEHEACKIIGVKSLRDFFRKPAGFFADHLKRYSKSRRQAPIYWPLSTVSGSYTLWIYYHRLTDQTLFQCVNDFVKPKLDEVNQDIERLRGELQWAGSSNQREKLEELEDFVIELKELHDELLRVASLPYKPNLNDGVLITASPLWKLVRLPKWQKDLKACWESLEAGEYDWAHLAYTIWPDRVMKVCKTDRSIAIAHGLEDLCDIKAPEKKAKRGKKKTVQMELEEGPE